VAGYAGSREDRGVPSTAIMLFTRDLRVHDNPALHAALSSADHVVPVFVLDEAITRLDYNRPNRAQFLADSLADLDRALKHRGGALITRRGDVAEEVAKLADETGADTVHLSKDYSRYAVRRESRLRNALGSRELNTHHGLVVVPPGDIATGSGEPFSVFTPYHRRWAQHAMRAMVPTPRKISLPAKIRHGKLPIKTDICQGATSPELMAGGETEARTRAKRWYDDGVRHYEDDHDALARDNTSRLSPYLHFGCISPLELVERADRRNPGAAAFTRQLCWRDFHHQVLAARPDVVDDDWRTQHDRWRRDDQALQAWKDGRTGYPLVDAGMRQLQREGWMHNRARLVTGSFLTKHLYVDWRDGARHFFDLLVDGDIANNTMNWQWIAGTGTDSRPNRMLNPTLQLERYDPDHSYVKTYVEEYGTEDYPAPIVEHKDAVAAFREARGKD
jgi:deoxyribodipyrimidine photo-lyase